MPLTVGSYLDLEGSAARAQWVSIEGRRLPANGKRQVDFVPVETLLCLASSLLVKHQAYGGSTAHLAEEPVPSLAQLFRRPPSSVLAKMANLDGSRPNGAKHELEVAVHLLSSEGWGRFIDLYLTIFDAAREVGISDSRLPDFLGMSSGYDMKLLGQHELKGVDIHQVLAPEIRRWSEKRSDLEDFLTAKVVEVNARIGQHRFAREVVGAHGQRCAFCGLSLRTKGAPASRMLIASHIKPWRECNARERTDPLNGVSACPTHDVAFDTGLIGIDEDLTLRLRADLMDRLNEEPVAAAFGAIAEGSTLQLPDHAVPPRVEYIRWHGDHVYQVD